MKVYKAKIAIEGSGKIYEIGALKIEGVFWFVATWTQYPDEGYQVPEIAFRTDQEPLSLPDGSLVVPRQVPEAVVYQGREADGYEVRFDLDVRVPMRLQ